MDYAQIRDYANQMYNYAREGDYRIVYPTKQYYIEGLESPSTAMLIMQDEVRKQTADCFIEAHEEYTNGNKNAFKEFVKKTINTGKNQQKADMHNMVIDSKRAFCAKIQKLYPATGPKRVAIIDKGAVIFDYVTPKFTGIKKFLLARLAKKYMRQMR